LQLAGDFSTSQLNLTVQTFVSAFCIGKINRELPSQFYSWTIQEVLDARAAGDRAAAKCIKLIGEPRFRK
jgi:hypothetical protein